MVFNNFSWKSHSQIGQKLGFAASKTVSNACRFCSISDEKMMELKKESIKNRTLAKIKWAVKAFNDWHNNVLNNS